MNAEKQRIAIAELCGWTDMEVTRVGGILLYGQTEVPDYLHDLNAMHEAISHRIREPRVFSKWSRELVTILIRDGEETPEGLDITDMHTPVEMCGLAALATSGQLAEAWLKTFGEWEEE